VNWWIDESKYPGPRFLTWVTKITVVPTNRRNYARAVSSDGNYQLPSGINAKFYCQGREVGKVILHEKIQSFFGGSTSDEYTVELYSHVDIDDPNYLGGLNPDKAYVIQ
jgi:hypothetical protein